MHHWTFLETRTMYFERNTCCKAPLWKGMPVGAFYWSYLDLGVSGAIWGVKPTDSECSTGLCCKFWSCALRIIRGAVHPRSKGIMSVWQMVYIDDVY